MSSGWIRKAAKSVFEPERYRWWQVAAFGIWVNAVSGSVIGRVGGLAVYESQTQA